MAEKHLQVIARLVVSSICKQYGFDRCQRSALDLFAHILMEFFYKQTLLLKDVSAQSNRTIPHIFDMKVLLGKLFNENSINELIKYSIAQHKKVKEQKLIIKSYCPCISKNFTSEEIEGSESFKYEDKNQEIPYFTVPYFLPKLPPEYTREAKYLPIDISLRYQPEFEDEELFYLLDDDFTENLAAEDEENVEYNENTRENEERAVTSDDEEESHIHVSQNMVKFHPYLNPNKFKPKPLPDNVKMIAKKIKVEKGGKESPKKNQIDTFTFEDKQNIHKIVFSNKMPNSLDISRLPALLQVQKMRPESTSAPVIENLEWYAERSAIPVPNFGHNVSDLNMDPMRYSCFSDNPIDLKISDKFKLKVSDDPPDSIETEHI